MKTYTKTKEKKITFFTLLFAAAFLQLSAQETSPELINLLLQKKIIRQSEADSLLLHSGNETNTKPKNKYGKVWGLVYTDAIFKSHADSARRGNVQYSGTPQDSSGLDFRRIYLGYDYTFNEHISTEFILAHESGTDILSSGNRGVFVKAANLRWKELLPLTDLIIGIQGTPAFSFEGDRPGAIYPYRSVERSLADMRKLSISSDAGIQVQGRFNQNGSLGYNLMVGNGSGTKPENDKFKRLYGEVYAWFLNKSILFDVYADYERSKLSPKLKANSTFKVFLAYQNTRITAGIEAAQQYQEHANIFTEAAAGTPGVIGTKKDTVLAVALGLSAFLRGYIVKEKLSVFLRYDYFNPDLKFLRTNFYSASYSGNTVQRFFMGGLDYSPEKNIHIIPNVWYNEYNATSDASNKVHPASLLERDYDLVYRVTLTYVFNR